MRCAVVLAGVLGLAAGQGYIGRLDTIGGTTYDWQLNAGPAKTLASSPPYGMHAVWMRSADTSGMGFADRNLGYQFYDYTTRCWNWIDPDFMQSGVNAFTMRAGFGNVDPDPASGVAVLGAHVAGSSGTVTFVARDVAPGAAIFEYASGESVGASQWPRTATGQNGTIHVFSCSAAYTLLYTRIKAGNWPIFEPGRVVDPSGGFPTQTDAASKVSGRVCLLWEMSGYVPEDAYMQLSTDNGETWTDNIPFPPPDAYGGDTVTSFHISSLYPWFDYEDRLHVVAGVMPIVHDTGYVMPAQIWHWCEANNPPWNRIHIAGCAPGNLQGSIGYNAIYATRPTIGEGNDARLYVSWEQFDSSNVEPVTNLLRAGVWYSSSLDNGVTWTPGVLVTERNSVSHRFPCIVDRMVHENLGDVVCILYLADLQAGFWVQGQGSATLNPVICQFVPTWPGVGEGRAVQVASPRPGPTVLSGASSVQRLASSVVFDATGRRVTEPRSGVYFVRAEPQAASPNPQAVRKVVVQE